MLYIALAAFNLACAVMLGAFGAHGLKHIANEIQLGWWQTATDYFFYHALGLLLLGLLSLIQRPISQYQLRVKLSFILMQSGILVFSGSLYAMALGMPKILGAITPFGGALLIFAWLSLAWQAWQQHRSNPSSSF